MAVTMLKFRQPVAHSWTYLLPGSVAPVDKRGSQHISEEEGTQKASRRCTFPESQLDGPHGIMRDFQVMAILWRAPGTHDQGTKRNL